MSDDTTDVKNWTEWKKVIEVADELKGVVETGKVDAVALKSALGKLEHAFGKKFDPYDSPKEFAVAELIKVLNKALPPEL